MKFLIPFLIAVSFNALAFKELHCPGPGHDFLVADPAIVESENSVLVMGTGDILKWKNLKSLVSLDTAQKESLNLFKEITVANHTVIAPMAPWELPWDLQFYQIDGEKYLYGGVMSPLPEITNARWPEDNISRRIKVATYDASLKGWVFAEKPVFGTISHSEWKGHSYGQQIIRTKSGFVMFHEEITRDGVTEIYLRKMETPFHAGTSKKLVGMDDLPEELTRRVDGGHLLEGPRYTKTKVDGRDVHLIFFSTGDFPTKNYATRVAYSFKSLEGPYTVIPDDITEAAENAGLHGVGRAFPFRYENKDWIIFHGAKDKPGVDHTKWPENLDNFKRCLFISPLKLEIKNSHLKIKLI